MKLKYKAIAFFTGAILTFSTLCLSGQVTATIGHATPPSLNNGVINLIIYGGMPPYEFLWEGGETSNPLKGLSPGKYCVTVRDKFCCTATECFTVISCPDISLEYKKTPASGPLAVDGVISLEVAGGAFPYIYEWSNGFGGVVNIGLPPSFYCVRATDVNGCKNVIWEELGYECPAITLTPTITPTSTTSSSDGAITISTNLGASPFEYSWTDSDGKFIPNTTNTIQGLSCGEYFVTATDAVGCTVEGCFLCQQP